MGQVTLNDIFVKKLNEIDVKGGNVIKGLKISDKNFHGFGEIYFSSIKKDHIKAWKKHNEMFMNLIVIKGKVKFVFYLENKNIFREEILEQNNYSIITVPPKIWFGFKGIGQEESLIMNCASIEHNPDESDALHLEQIQYSW